MPCSIDQRWLLAFFAQMKRHPHGEMVIHSMRDPSVFASPAAIPKSLHSDRSKGAAKDYQVPSRPKKWTTLAKRIVPDETIRGPSKELNWKHCPDPKGHEPE